MHKYEQTHATAALLHYCTTALLLQNAKDE
jgi:hypothetical protein